MLNGRHATMLSTAYRPGGGCSWFLPKGFYDHTPEKHVESFFYAKKILHIKTCVMPRKNCEEKMG
jgi:hypothetical protein